MMTIDTKKLCITTTSVLKKNSLIHIWSSLKGEVSNNFSYSKRNLPVLLCPLSDCIDDCCNKFGPGFLLVIVANKLQSCSIIIVDDAK